MRFPLLMGKKTVFICSCSVIFAMRASDPLSPALSLSHPFVRAKRCD